MKNNIWFKLGGAALLGLMILGFAGVGVIAYRRRAQTTALTPA